MTHAELSQLAQDIFYGKVFGSWMVAPEHMKLMERIFVPLQWAFKGQYNLPNDIATLYEYRDKAWPLTIEGYPVFFSMKFLTKDELSKLQIMLRTLQKIKEGLDGVLRNLDERDSSVGGVDGGRPEPATESPSPPG